MEDCLRSCNDLAAQTHCCLSSALSTTICKPLFVTMVLPRKNSLLHVVLNRCVLATTLFAIYFSALLLRGFPSTSGVLLHLRSSGKLFNLSRFWARSKTRWVFMRELYSIRRRSLCCPQYSAGKKNLYIQSAKKNFTCTICTSS